MTISVICKHMTDKTLGSEVERYATIPALYGSFFDRKRLVVVVRKFARRLALPLLYCSSPDVTNLTEMEWKNALTQVTIISLQVCESLYLTQEERGRFR